MQHPLAKGRLILIEFEVDASGTVDFGGRGHHTSSSRRAEGGGKIDISHSRLLLSQQ